MAVSAILPRLQPYQRVSPLRRVKGSLRQAAKTRRLPLTRLRGWYLLLRFGRKRFEQVLHQLTCTK
jgi:hypothetical protein